MSYGKYLSGNSGLTARDANLGQTNPGQQFADPNYSGPGALETGLGGLASGLGTFAATANPYLALGSAGLNLYQQFKNQDAADKNYELQMAQFRQQQNDAAEANKRAQAAQGIQNMYTDANYASGLAKETYDPYKAYFSQVGR